MVAEAVKSFADRNTSRFLADGVEYVDIVDVVNAATDINDWCSKWMDRALVYQRFAEESLTKGFKVTAGVSFWRASLYNHYGQFMEWNNRQIKDEAVRRKVDTYNRGAPLFQPPSERIEVPFENVTLPGFLRVPSLAKKPPCVLLIGGLESTKEEFNSFESHLVSRGLATFAFDGPGQGETYYKMKSRPDFEKAISAVIDCLEKREEIDSSRIGVLGRSMGGYYAPRAAAFEERITACVAWPGKYEFVSNWGEQSKNIKDGRTYVSGKNSWDEAREHYASFTLEGVAKKIKCPLYLVQGELDEICPPAQSKKIADEAAGPTTLEIVLGGNHCVHNKGQLYRQKMADWLSQQLAVKM